MVTSIILGDLLARFNSFFEGDAQVEVKENRLEITIGSRIMVISLPSVIGVQAKDSS